MVRSFVPLSHQFVMHVSFERPGSSSNGEPQDGMPQGDWVQDGTNYRTLCRARQMHLQEIHAVETLPLLKLIVAYLCICLSLSQVAPCAPEKLQMCLHGRYGHRHFILQKSNDTMPALEKGRHTRHCDRAATAEKNHNTNPNALSPSSKANQDCNPQPSDSQRTHTSHTSHTSLTLTIAAGLCRRIGRSTSSRLSLQLRHLTPAKSGRRILSHQIQDSS